MSTNVYFRKIGSQTEISTIQEITKQLLDTIVEKGNIALDKKIPLKVHFGEQKKCNFHKT